MPKITKLTSQKRGEFVNLYIDDEFFCGLSLNQVAAHRLHKGQEMTDAELLALKQEANQSKAYHAGLRYVSLRIRSEKEMQDYLRRKGYEDDAVTAALARLRSERYLNDIDFTERWIAMRRAQHWSPRAIQADLMKKGLRIDSADPTMAQGESIQDSIASLIHKKTRHRTVEREKLMQFLAGKGFQYADIKLALDSYESEINL